MSLQANPMIGFWGSLGADLGGAVAQGVTAHRDTLKQQHDYYVAQAIAAKNAAMAGDPSGWHRAHDYATKAHELGGKLFGDNTAMPDLAETTTRTSTPLGALDPGAPDASGQALRGGLAPTAPLNGYGALSLDPSDILGQKLNPDPAGQTPTTPAPMTATESKPVDWGALTPRQEAMIAGEVGGSPPQYETVPFGGSVFNKATGKVVFQDDGRLKLAQTNNEARAGLADKNNAARLDREKLALQTRTTIAQWAQQGANQRLVQRLQVSAKDPASHELMLTRIASAMAGPRSLTDVDGSEHAASVKRYLEGLRQQFPAQQGGSPTGQGPFPPAGAR